LRARCFRMMLFGDLYSKTSEKRKTMKSDEKISGETPPAEFTGRSIENLMDACLDKMEVAMDCGDSAAAEKHFEKAERLFAFVDANYAETAVNNGPAPSLREKGKEMNSEAILTGLQEEQKRLIAGVEWLKQREEMAFQQVKNHEEKYTEVLIQAALGEPIEPAVFHRLDADFARLVGATMAPYAEARERINEQLEAVSRRIANEQAAATVREHMQRYRDARAAMIERGSYTVPEMAELEHLASVAGCGVEFQQFRMAMGDYIFRRDLSANREDFPAFEYEE